MNINIVEPHIVINSFNDEATQKYIDALENITMCHPIDQVILVEIDSYGGSAYNCIRLIEKFNTVQNPIATYCASKAMSSGLFLAAIIGSQGLRFASPMARFMLHEIQGGAVGDMKEVENRISDMKNVNDMMLEFFAKRVGLKGAKAVRNLIRERSLGNEYNFDAETAKELHIIDDIKYIRTTLRTYFELQTAPKEDSRYNLSYVVQTETKKNGRKK